MLKVKLAAIALSVLSAGCGNDATNHNKNLKPVTTTGGLKPMGASGADGAGPAQPKATTPP